jgi:glycosyltransferase involved in cell wall biosynthesis
MRVAQISTLSAPVREETFGSVESFIWLLTRELQKLGHELTVFATGDSDVNCELVGTQPGPYGSQGSLDDWQLCDWVNLCRAVEQSGRFDVLHSHAYCWGIPLQKFSRAPLVHTTHLVPDENSAKLWRSSPQSCVTAISNQQWSAFPDLKPAAVIPHGVDIAKFPFQKTPEDYVLYLGRFVSGKGPKLAIEAARKLGTRLIMAGPENVYFREQIKPLIDGKNVEYVGFVKGAERSKLLGGAKALVYPIQFPEAFGLVLIEAMLCGTPIAATNFGAVPEIIQDGVTGIIAKSKEEFAATIPKCFALDRAAIRACAEKRFSAERMARDYGSFYEKIVSQKP